MKQYIVCLLFFLTSLSVFSQTQPIFLNGCNVWELHDPPTDRNVVYQAKEYTKLMRDFSFKAEANEIFIGKVNPDIICSTKYINPIDIENRVINTNLPVGSTTGMSEVTPTGAFTYTVPIYCSPGTNGMQPQVSLNYSSQGGNGNLGWGWSLGGLSMISRAGKDMYNDNEVKQFANVQSDNLTLDGNRLVLKEGTIGNLNAVFGTEVGNTSRIYPQEWTTEGVTWFKVQSKEGMWIEYGGTENSRITVSYLLDGVNKTCIIAWRINKVTDLFGNYMEYEYENIEGENCLKRIKYTGNTNTGLQPYASLEFYYSLRSDANRSYVAIDGTSIKTSSPKSDNSTAFIPQVTLLDRIDAKYGTEIVRSYRMEYVNEKNAFLGISLLPLTSFDNSFLSVIIEEDKDDEQFNPIVFSYYKDINDTDYLMKFSELTPFHISNLGREDLLFGDFNGDGITDRMLLERNQDIGGVKKAIWHLQYGQYFDCQHGQYCGDYSFIDAQTGENGTTKMFETLDFKKEHYKLILDKAITVDMDGDGKDEILVPYYNGYRTEGKDHFWYIYIDIYKFNGMTFDVVSRIITQTHNEKGSFWAHKSKLIILPGDYNGDGKIDLLIQMDEDYWYRDWNLSFSLDHTNRIADYVELFDTSGNWIFSPIVEENKFDFFNEKTIMIPIALNINRKTDLLTVARDANGPLSRVYELNSSGNFVETYKHGIQFSDDHFVYNVGDFNGDGLNDLIYGKLAPSNQVYTNIYIRINTGNGFSEEFALNNYMDAWSSEVSQYLIGDMNGDGKSDIVIVRLVKDANSNLCSLAKYTIYFSKGFNQFEVFHFETEDPHYFPIIQLPDSYGPDSYKLLTRLSMLQLFDFNGDGNADIFSNGASGYGKFFSFYANSNPLHLKSISDGYGNKTEVKYEIVSKPNSVYITENNSQLPLYDLKANMYVVSEVEKYQYDFVRNATNIVQNYTYKYENGLIHKYKGFLGFKKFTVTSTLADNNNNPNIIVEEITESDFMYPYPSANKDYAFYPKKQIKNILTETSTGEWNSTQVSETTSLFQRKILYTPGYPNSYFDAVAETISKDNLKGISSRTISQVDSYENIYNTQTRHYQGTSTTLVARTIEELEFNVFSNLKSWCPNNTVERKISTSYHIDDGTPYSRYVDFEYYDETKGYALKKVVNDNGAFTEYDYNQFGGKIFEKLHHTTPNSLMHNIPLPARKFFQEFDSKGRFVIKEWNEAGHTKEFSYYEATGNIKKSTDVDGKETKFFYDGFGRENKVTNSFGQSVYTNFAWNNSTAFLNQPGGTSYIKIISADNAPSQWVYYSSLGRELQAETESFGEHNIISKKTYYFDGRLKEQTSPHFVGSTDYTITTTEYDDKLRVSRIFTEENASPFNSFQTSTSYGTNENSVTITEPNGKVTKKVYDAMGLLVQSIEVSNGNNTMSYTYKSNFKPWEVSSTVIDKPNTKLIENEYDDFGNLVKKTDMNLGVFTYEYNPYGEILRQKLKTKGTFGSDDGFYEYFQYDNLGRIEESKVYEETSTVPKILTESKVFAYVLSGDGIGRVQTITLKDGASTEKHKIEYFYDDYARVIKQQETVDPDNKTFVSNYTFDSKGRPLTKEYPSGVKVMNEYNAKGFLTSIKRIDVYPSQTVWEMTESNAFGKITEYKTANGKITNEKGFDLFMLPTSITSSFNNTTVLQDYVYEWYPNKQNLQKRTDKKNSSKIQTESFEYDDIDRLEKITINPGSSAVDVGINYNQDGTIDNKDDIGFYEYTSLGNLVFPYHAVKEIHNQNFVPVSYSGNNLSFEFDHYRRYNKIASLSSSYTIDYIYGLGGSRIKMVENIFTEKYYADNCELIIDNANSTEKLITYISTPNGVAAAIVQTTVMSVKTESTYFIAKDYLGSIVGLTKVDMTSSNSFVQHYDFSYDAWGKMRNPEDWTEFYSDMSAVSGFDILARGFTGHEHILAFNLINMNARIYDPEIASFISPDNEITYPENPQNYNRYSYAMNNPLKYSDPSGNHPIFMIFAVLYTLQQTAVNWGNHGADAGGKTLIAGASNIGSTYIFSGLGNTFLTPSQIAGIAQNSFQAAGLYVGKSLVLDYISTVMTGGKYSLRSALSATLNGALDYSTNYSSSSQNEGTARNEESGVSGDLASNNNNYTEDSAPKSQSKNLYYYLSQRPDADGILTPYEAEWWAINGKEHCEMFGSDMTLKVDISKIDLSKVTTKDFNNEIGKTATINLYSPEYFSSSDDAQVYGSLTLKYYGDGNVKAFWDKYDTDLHLKNWSFITEAPRNFSTMGLQSKLFIKSFFSGKGGNFDSYQINIYGTAKIRIVK